MQKSNIIEGYRRYGLPGEKYEHFKKRHIKTLSLQVAELLANVSKREETLKAGFAETFDEHFRLLCTSRRRDSILMWSHYAANHTGCALGIDLTQPPFVDLGEHAIGDVRYAKEKKTYDGDLPQKERIKGMFDVVFTKFDDWSYEREVRILLPHYVGDFCDLPNEALFSICFGARATVEKRREITELLNRPEWLHVAIYQARLHPHCFQLEFTEIRPTKKPTPKDGP